MMNFFSTDIRRALTERTFTASLIIAVLSLLGAFVYLGISERDNSFLMSQSLVFPFIAPFLAALPFSAIIITERATKYRDLIKLRRHGKNYVQPRFFTVGISGGLALLLPELLLFAVTHIMGMNGFETENLQVLSLSFPFGFAYAVLAFSFTFYNNEAILPLMIPEVFYLLFTYAFPYLDLEKFYPPLAVSPFIYGLPDLQNIFTALGLLTLFAGILTLIGSIKERVQNV
jgi:hypothetical protein